MSARPVRVSPPSWPYASNGASKISSFLDLGVSATLTRRLDSLGLTTPLPIQTATIPAALAGRDICGQAPTGSGKTLAFAVPIAETSRDAAPRAPRALVLVPTRELAEQVRNVLSSLLPRPDRVVSIYGGTGYEGQRKALRRGVDVVVACPGRLEDLLERRDLRLDAVDLVVLDEVDRMVDMGFLRPVCRLLDQTADKRQVLLFSATIGPEVESVIGRYQRDPLRHEAGSELLTDVTHLFWRVPRPDRVSVTAQLVAERGQAFVFCRTKRSADRVAKQLRAEDVEAVPMHGDRTQVQRARALAAFAAGRVHALVATDVVARGIHVEDVPCVVHFDPPGDANSYVHRSGRTGRSGRSGVVVSLVPDDLRNDVRGLQRDLGFRTELTKPFDGASLTAIRPGKPPKPIVAERRPRVHPAPRLVPAVGSRVSGTVKFFDTARGYGFLSGPDGADIFVHHSKVTTAVGRHGLRKGDPVSFAIALGRRGHEAHDVTARRQGAA